MAGQAAQRFGTLFIAVIFLLTSIGFTLLLFWDSKNRESDSTQSTALEGGPQNPTNNTQQEANMLQGSPLANFTPITDDVTELQIIDTVVGDGAEAKKGDNITAHYTGAYVVNGEVFESSLDSGRPFDAYVLTASESPDGRGLIEGWVEGIPGMKVGGTRRLIIPGEKAYGSAPEGYVPGGGGQPLGPLVFDIQLLSVNQ